jgi:thiamine-phosphate diphosphorylase
MAPVVCLITDRRRWGTDWENALVTQIGSAAAAGAHLIQVREPDLDGAVLHRLVVRCVAAVASTPARIIVNDRADVARAAGAHGVHLKADSMPAARLREWCPRPFLIGQSIHAVADLPATTGTALDYLLFGTVFATASKPGRAPAGTQALAALVQETALPVLAVGGVTGDNLGEVAATGAAGVATIGFLATHTAARVRQLADLSQWIDTGVGHP